MHGNNPHAGLPGGIAPAGQPPGVEPESLSDSERDSLRSFAASIASETESYLPEGYWVDTTFEVSQGILSLGVTVGCPVGGMIQCEIRPTILDDEDTEEDSDNNTENPNESEATKISQQLAATAAFQTRHMMEYNETHQPAS